MTSKVEQSFWTDENGRSYSVNINYSDQRTHYKYHHVSEHHLERKATPGKRTQWCGSLYSLIIRAADHNLWHENRHAEQFWYQQDLALLPSRASHWHWSSSPTSSITPGTPSPSQGPTINCPSVRGKTTSLQGQPMISVTNRTSTDQSSTSDCCKANSIYFQIRTVTTTWKYPAVFLLFVEPVVTLVQVEEPQTPSTRLEQKHHRTWWN